jgi:broad specificity phosphatase PhoE
VSSSVPDAKRPPPGATRASGAASLIPEGLDSVLVLLRHGQTQFIVEKRFQGQMEAPLTLLGERQAQLAGLRLARPRADPPLPIPDTAPFAIVHSPLGRAFRTAEFVAEAMTTAGRATPPLRPDSGFLEIGQGEWEGLKDTEIHARFGESLAAWRHWPTRFYAPGGESLAQVRARVEASLAVLLADLAEGTQRGTMDRHQVLGYADTAHQSPRWALIVGHGGVFRVVVCVLLGLAPEHFWNFDFGLASITVVEIRAGRAVLRSVNLDEHLGSEDKALLAESTELNRSGAL